MITSLFVREGQVQVNVSPSALKRKNKVWLSSHDPTVLPRHAAHKTQKYLRRETEKCVNACVLYQSVTLFVRLGLREVRLAPGLHQPVARAALHRPALRTQTLTPETKRHRSKKNELEKLLRVINILSLKQETFRTLVEYYILSQYRLK